MDKLTIYKNAIHEVVKYIASIAPSDENVETQLIMDDERGHYLLYSVGWENADDREHTAFVHIDIKPDGKIWIQHDGTDLRIAQTVVFLKHVFVFVILQNYKSYIFVLDILLLIINLMAPATF